MLYINTRQAYDDFKAYLTEDNPKIVEVRGNVVITDDYEVTVEPEFKALLNHPVLRKESKYDPVIFGKSDIEHIVSIEVEDDTVKLFKMDGSIQELPMVYWAMSPKNIWGQGTKLQGNQHYKYIFKFDNQQEFNKFCGVNRKQDIYRVWDLVESAMIYYGLTYHKDMKVNQLSVLSFDIEASGLVRDDSSEVFLITNTFRDRKGNLTKKHFRVDHYEDDGAMIGAWCQWVNEVDPDVITGHNIYGYDLPYLNHCSTDGLKLGRDGSAAKFAQRSSNFRVDGNTTWEYNKINIYGREIVDGMFLAVKYDIGRKYVSWGLKQIAEQEGFVKEDRQFYDASKIGQNWSDPVEREKIVAYGIDDSDDSLAIYDLMISSFFYMTQSVPKSFQTMCISASGSQLNSVMVRAYMQDGHSIPKASEKEYVFGGISFGNPGLYRNVFKIDLASLYPSIIRAFKLYPKSKDPKGYYLRMANIFTEERFRNKRLYKKTGEEYYNDMQASYKVFINSLFGLGGTSGLNFNDFELADQITGYARQIIRFTMKWAGGHDIHKWWVDYEDEKDQKYMGLLDESKIVSHDFLVNAGDTDSISFHKKNFESFSEEERIALIEELNSILPEHIEYEDDGYFSHMLVCKAKNYCLVEDGSTKIKKKGSSILDSKKAPALREMLDKSIENIIFHESSGILQIFEDYIKEVRDMKDIKRWCAKKSISSKVLNPQRANEQKILDAVKHLSPREGDKYFLYTAVDGEKQKVAKGEPVFLKSGKPSMVKNSILKVAEDWTGDEDKEHYYKRVYMTMEILKNVIDMSQLTKFHNKSNIKKVEDL